MTMGFPYINYRTGQPVHSLGGRANRPRPVIGVTLFGPTGHLLQDALLDSGADDTVFPDHLAPQLGIDLSNAPSVVASGLGGSQVVVRYVTIRLRVADNQEKREWAAIVGFGPIANRLPVLGFAGFLQYFTATFHGDREVVELSVNALYPGT
jgi:hypothetical protein